MSRDYPDPWQCERDAVIVAILGKLLEELGELSSATARCLIQGVHESDPETGIPNVVWLEDEIADVFACLAFLKTHFDLDSNRIDARAHAKTEHHKKWHELIKR